MKKTSIIALMIFTIAGLSFAQEEKNKTVKKPTIKLKQIDYRHRVNTSISIPGLFRVRVRPSYEYRFRFKK